jgi:hypothetical protein
VRELWQNTFGESFNGHLRDDYLNAEWFYSRAYFAVNFAPFAFKSIDRQSLDRVLTDPLKRWAIFIVRFAA